MIHHLQRLTAQTLHYLRKIASLTGLSSHSFHSSPEAGHSYYVDFSNRSARTRQLPELSCYGCIHWKSKVGYDAEIGGNCYIDGMPPDWTYDHEICYDWEGYYHD